MKILIVGISVRSMIESAVRSSYSVSALDEFGDRDLKAMAEAHSLHHDFHCAYSPKALYEASRKLAFDAVAYTSNLENHPQILRRFAESRPVLGNSPHVIEAVRHWPTLFSKLRSAGFDVPDTIFAGESRKADAARRWLIKPVLSGGGHRVRMSQSGKLPNGHFMLQEYFAGKPCSAAFVANGHECVVLGVTEQLIGMSQFGSPGFRYCGNILPLPEILDPNLGHTILKQVSRLASFLTQEFDLTGVNSMDFILNGDQVCLTEVNPRYSASMELMEEAFKLPVFHMHVNAALNGRLPVFSLRAALDGKRFFGKCILFAESDAIAPDTLHWLTANIRDIPASGERLRRSAPVCTILANRPTYAATLAELISRAEKIKEEIYVQSESDVDYGTLYRAGQRHFDWKRGCRVSGSNQCD